MHFVPVRREDDPEAIFGLPPVLGQLSIADLPPLPPPRDHGDAAPPPPPPGVELGGADAAGDAWPAPPRMVAPPPGMLDMQASMAQLIAFSNAFSERLDGIIARLDRLEARIAAIENAPQ